MTVTKKAFMYNINKAYTRNYISSLPEYLEYVNYIQNHWNNYQLWFRGLSDTRHRLIPSIYRNSVWTYNKQLAHDVFYEFIRKARVFVERELSDYEWYQLMQHYGLPTRLLDWTEGSLLALYFAVRNINENREGTPCVWVIDPYWLNAVSEIKDEYTISTDIVEEEYEDVINKYHDELGDLPNYPISILPGYKNPRIAAQRSTFTIHGRYYDGFRYLYQKTQRKSHLLQIRINSNDALEIKNELLTAGINETTVFPDIDGLAKEFKTTYGMN